MKSHIKLTDAAVQALPLASGVERFYVHDLGLTGLTLQVTKFKRAGTYTKASARDRLNLSSATSLS